MDTHFARTGARARLDGRDASVPAEHHQVERRPEERSGRGPRRHQAQGIQPPPADVLPPTRPTVIRTRGSGTPSKGRSPRCTSPWVEHEDPWYATVTGRNCAAPTCTAVAWLKAINGYMGKQKVTFKKTCSGSRRLRGRRRTYAKSPTAANPQFLLRPSTAAQRRGASLRHRVMHVSTRYTRMWLHHSVSRTSVARRGARGRRCRGPRSPRGRRATTVGMGATASREPPLTAARARRRGQRHRRPFRGTS